MPTFHPPAVAWPTFLLVLALVLTVLALIQSKWKGTLTWAVLLILVVLLGVVR